MHARLAEARDRGWLGEVDGLEATIAAADHKLTTMRRTAHRRRPVDLAPPPSPAVAKTYKI